MQRHPSILMLSVSVDYLCLMCFIGCESLSLALILTCNMSWVSDSLPGLGLNLISAGVFPGYSPASFPRRPVCNREGPSMGVAGVSFSSSHVPVLGLLQATATRWESHHLHTVTPNPARSRDTQQLLGLTARKSISRFKIKLVLFKVL